MADDAMHIGFKEDIATSLNAFVDEVREKAFRPSAFAAVSVLYDEMHLRTPVGPTRKIKIKATGTVITREGGTLKASIYRYHDVKKSDKSKQIYAVGPNKRKAPHWHMVEYGTVKSAANPYIRPTYDAKIGKALDTATEVMTKEIEKLS